MAHLAGIPIGTVKANLHRAKQRLRAGSESTRIPRWLTVLSGFCNPVAAGIMLLVFGATLVFDLGGVPIWGEKGLAAPTPLLVAATALCISGMYLSNRLSED